MLENDNLIGVVILNYFSFAHCAKLIESVKSKSSSDYNIKIILVDNSCDDVERERFENSIFFSDLFYIANRSNWGYSKGNNIGIRAAIEMNCTYIAIINPDVRIIDLDIWEELILKVNFFFGVPVIVGPQVYNPYTKSYDSPLNEPNYFKDLFRFSLTPVARNSGVVHSVVGCFLFGSVDTFLKVGLLPEEIFMYNEETILAHKLKSSGGFFFYLDEVKIEHLHSKHFKGFSHEWSRKMAQLKSVTYVAEKYYNYGFFSKTLYKILFLLRSFMILTVKWFMSFRDYLNRN